MTDITFAEVAGEQGDLGVITLNRPQALNALTLPMIQLMSQHLRQWEVQPSIKAIVVRATPGRAFCAGGDIKYVYEQTQLHNPNVIDYFKHEYSLNRLIHHYSKPYIAFIDGLIMGGGAGISIHGSHRVMTDKVTFAMPETKIGFFPDIGSSFYLARLPHHFGLYLGLTGARITAADCLSLGFATHHVVSEDLDKIFNDLLKAPLKIKDEVPAILDKYVLQIEAPIKQHLVWIDQVFGNRNLEEILHALEEENNPASQETLKTLQEVSPLSLQVTLQQLRKAAHLDFDGCIQLDYQLVRHFLNDSDFMEGIRAAIIDKGSTPNWKYKTVAKIPQEIIDKFFVVKSELVWN